ncbi:hypothetical protein K505DRAFT_11461 [Melanomma pulvis-pyrius CBS 109.77]|uniref:Uncharacterized protein n=1 Tax=Melanomma pulvis-pyrius CBS 109.77 TaxID=1314802 RepID=A0A6A6XH71_9PLEO|nr:hypothetical protein K505DRAFT_11461 [Melanomma pulvis-pyrius CBS 109.77]
MGAKTWAMGGSNWVQTGCGSGGERKAEKSTWAATPFRRRRAGWPISDAGEDGTHSLVRMPETRQRHTTAIDPRQSPRTGAIIRNSSGTAGVRLLAARVSRCPTNPQSFCYTFLACQPSSRAARHRASYAPQRGRLNRADGQKVISSFRCERSSAVLRIHAPSSRGPAALQRFISHQKPNIHRRGSQWRAVPCQHLLRFSKKPMPHI